MFSETVQFDALGRLLKDIGGAAAQTWVYAHDKEDNLTSVTDPQSLVTTNAFDQLNRIVQLTDRDAGVTLTPRNDSDLMTAFTDPRTITTAFA